MFRFVAETPRFAKLSPSFSTREEAVDFGRNHWAKIRRADTRICRVLDDETHRTETLWMDPRELPTGHYGVDGKRYFISRPQKGDWAGWTFLKTGSDYHDRKTLAMVKPDGTVIKPHKVLTAICADPTEAAAEYGRITGTCRACGRKLESKWRHVGIGPKCAKKWGIA